LISIKTFYIITNHKISNTSLLYDDWISNSVRRIVSKQYTCLRPHRCVRARPYIGSSGTNIGILVTGMWPTKRLYRLRIGAGYPKPVISLVSILPIHFLPRFLIYSLTITCQPSGLTCLGPIYLVAYIVNHDKKIQGRTWSSL
jgi:hypothetical protein